MINKIIYIIYNLIYQIFIICFVFYANTFLNNIFIPNSFIWKDGHRREDMLPMTITQSVILVIQVSLLMLLIYFIDKWFLLNIVKSNNSKDIAIRTIKVYSIITFIFLAYFIYAISK